MWNKLLNSRVSQDSATSDRDSGMGSPRMSKDRDSGMGSPRVSKEGMQVDQQEQEGENDKVTTEVHCWTRLGNTKIHALSAFTVSPVTL